MESQARTGVDATASTRFGELLRHYRLRAGLSQQALAELAGLSVEAVGALERGSRRRPYPHTVRALATALGLGEGERHALVAAIPPPTSDGEAPQPAAPPAPGRRSGLPTPPTLIVGREREEAAIVRLLERADVRLVTLTGPGGVGKTRLALQVAIGLGDRLGEVCFVDLSVVRDPGLVPASIAHALGLPERGRLGPLDNLIAMLAAQPRLVLLDNFEQVIDAAPVVAELLSRCPRLTLLVTSRAPLRLRVEREFELRPFAIPNAATDVPAADLLGYPAVRLFVERAQAVSPTFVLTPTNGWAIAAICRELDGLPLAIELAAARTRVLSPAALLGRLTARLELLTDAPLDAPPRQRTLRDAIAWSDELLSPAEQALFRRLAVFVGGFDLEAAEAVGGDGSASVLDLVSSLLRQSLVHHSPGEGASASSRLTMLETIREYALELLAASDDATVIRDAHAAYFLALAERAAPELAGPAQRLWLDRLEAEHPNLRAALDWLTARGDLAAALRLAAACSWLWWYRGHFAEGCARLAALLALPGAASHTRPWAAAMSGLGMLTHAQGDYVQAAGRFEQAVAAWRRLEVADRLTEALLMQGLALLYAGDAHASSILAESVAISRPLAPAPWLGIGLCSLGVAQHRQGDLTGAEAALEEALACSRAQENPMGIAISLMGLGDLARTRGDDASAFSLLRQAMAHFRDLGEIWSAILCLEYLAATLTRPRPLAASRLLAAASAWREAAGLPLPPVEAPRHARDVAAVKDALGEEAFAAAWASGHPLTPDQAIAEALAVDDVTPPPPGGKSCPG